MSSETPRMTGPTLKVLGQLIANPLSGISGADISKATGIASGTLYPILFRLEKAGWLSSQWEDGHPSELGRPRKRLYQPTSLGMMQYKAAFQDIAPVGGRLIWQF